VANTTDIELLQPGDTIFNGQYNIERHLGSGGQGQVYLARHRIFGQVAVKRLHRHIADQPEGRTRFERELRITEELRGEHVIFIRNFDGDSTRDEWFGVMEFANSGSLKDKLDTEAPLSIVEAIELTMALCQALALVHQYPYVHGDLKPSNILFHTTTSGKRTLKLSDFGSAFQPVQAGVLPLPSGLKAARTWLYVAPELLDASDPEDTEALKVGADQRADIYAIGVILYEMLTGRPPFWEPSGESDDPMVHAEREYALLQKIKCQLPAEPKKQRSELLSSLNALVMKAFAKSPAERFNNVDEMRFDLEKILQEEKERLAELERVRPLAEQALEEKQWGQASDLLFEILSLAPDDQDAREKLRIVEDQQRLMGLRLEISRAMDKEEWGTAKTLVEEALVIRPDDTSLKAHQERIATQLAVAEILDQAKAAASQENWQKASDLCLNALKLDRSHAEALDLLNRAQRQSKIVDLRQQIETLHTQGEKQEELRKLKELQKEVPADAAITTRIDSLQKTIELETCYARAKQAFEEGKWKESIADLEKVVVLDKYYRFAAPMLLEAQERFYKEQRVEQDTERRQELQRLFEEGKEFIRRKQWQTAWKILEKICKDNHYINIISKKELFACVLCALGHQYAEAQEWYLAKRCFAKVLAYAPDYADARQQLEQAQDHNRLKRNYDIKKVLGVGGTSQVVYAEDLNRGRREVALKYLRASYVIKQGDAISRRFRKQARRCIDLNHPNIVRILAAEMRGVTENTQDSQEADVPVVVMEYVEGQDLTQLLRGTQGVSERRAINLGCQLCQALQYAHKHGILHLDIKPSNILIQPNGVLKLTDFAHTSHGTGGYRSPEQLQGSAKLDERTDIFAAGKVLYALLTGTLPIEDPLDEEDPKFQRIMPQLRTIIRKATATDPRDRYQSAQEMLEALQKVKLPIWLTIRYRMGDAWEVAKTWKGILAFVVVLLGSIVFPILTAEDTTALGELRADIATYLSTILGGNGPAHPSRSIGETRFVVNGAPIKDITRPHYITNTHQISIELAAQDADGKIISGDEIVCQWTFDPPLPEGAVRVEGECKRSYQVPENLDSQWVKVEIQGKSGSQIVGGSTDLINLILQAK
jgi:serine/threonine protein kinase